MATAAPNQNLPLFYNAVEPVNVTQHGKMKVRKMLKMGQVAKTHAIPVTVDEFTLAQRHYPIVFSIGDKPIPIALMGLNEGVNVYLDNDGRPNDPSIYIPAYIRRYPFLLARAASGQRRTVALLRPQRRCGRQLQGRRGPVRGRAAEPGDQGHPRVL